MFADCFRAFLGDFNHQQLPSRRLQTLWEWKNRVLLEEYYIFNVVIPHEKLPIPSEQKATTSENPVSCHDRREAARTIRF